MNNIKEKTQEKIIMNEMLNFKEIEELLDYTLQEFKRTIGISKKDKNSKEREEE